MIQANAQLRDWDKSFRAFSSHLVFQNVCARESAAVWLSALGSQFGCVATYGFIWLGWGGAWRATASALIRRLFVSVQVDRPGRYEWNGTSVGQLYQPSMKMICHSTFLCQRGYDTVTLVNYDKVKNGWGRFFCLCATVMGDGVIFTTDFMLLSDNNICL